MKNAEMIYNLKEMLYDASDAMKTFTTELENICAATTDDETDELLHMSLMLDCMMSRIHKAKSKISNLYN